MGALLQNKKIKSKSFNEKYQELGMLYMYKVGNKSLNHLFNSQICAIHCLGVICRSISRNFSEFCMETPCSPPINKVAGNQQKHLKFTLR